jgi:hypothetical protein
MKTFIGWLCYRIFLVWTREMCSTFPRASGWILTWAGWYANTRDEL